VDSIRADPGFVWGGAVPSIFLIIESGNAYFWQGWKNLGDLEKVFLCF